MGPIILAAFILALVVVLIVVHEAGHYLAGWVGGLPPRGMKLVLLAFPQHVALRDGDEWVSPVRDIHRYVAVSSRHLRSRWAAFGWVAGGMIVELLFTTTVWTVAVASGYDRLAFCVAFVSLGMYVINVCLMDLPWALRHRCAAGDTSGLWQIARGPAVLFAAAMLGGRIALVAWSA
jgi:hypothetical protein